ncbi:hypothetical protein Pelo_5042 [Pelomyxa schiedti]|nr:hypothetical protein Pelo_5042 [Pelomyxa schiedti]
MMSHIKSVVSFVFKICSVPDLTESLKKFRELRISPLEQQILLAERELQRLRQQEKNSQTDVENIVKAENRIFKKRKQLIDTTGNEFALVHQFAAAHNFFQCDDIDIDKLSSACITAITHLEHETNRAKNDLMHLEDFREEPREEVTKLNERLLARRNELIQKEQRSRQVQEYLKTMAAVLLFMYQQELPEHKRTLAEIAHIDELLNKANGKFCTQHKAERIQLRHSQLNTYINDRKHLGTAWSLLLEMKESIRMCHQIMQERKNQYFNEHQRIALTAHRRIAELLKLYASKQVTIHCEQAQVRKTLKHLQKLNDTKRAQQLLTSAHTDLEDTTAEQLRTLEEQHSKIMSATSKLVEKDSLLVTHAVHAEDRQHYCLQSITNPLRPMPLLTEISFDSHQNHWKNAKEMLDNKRDKLLLEAERKVLSADDTEEFETRRQVIERLKSNIDNRKHQLEAFRHQLPHRVIGNNSPPSNNSTNTPARSGNIALTLTVSQHTPQTKIHDP